MPTKTYKTKDSRLVTITGEWDEDIIAFNEANEKVGALALNVRQNDFPPHKNYVWFSHAKVESDWQKQGIATACICFARNEIYGHDMTIHAPSVLDTMKVHGNTLSIEGAKLVDRLRKLGFVAPDPAYINEDINFT